MTDFPSKTPWWFWLIGAVFLLWNIFGCAIYIVDKSVTDAGVLKFSGQAALDARHAYPLWASVAYGFAVWLGLLASILYLMRKKISVTLFIVSLVTAIICFIPNFTNSIVKTSGGDSYWVMPVIVVLLGLFEILFSNKMRSKGIIR